MKLKFLSIFALVLLNGCAISSYVVPDIDLSKQNIPTSSKISPKRIIVNKPYNDIDRVEFVVLRTRNNSDYNKYFEFTKTMMKKVGFKKIISESEFAKLIVENGVDDIIGSTYDLVALHKIYKELGPFLTITLTLDHTGNARWDNQIIIVDPESPEMIVKTHVYKTNWSSLDREFNYPSINFINDWYKASKK